MHCPARAIRRQLHYFAPFRGLILWGFAEYVGLFVSLHRSSLDLTCDQLLLRPKCGEAGSPENPGKVEGIIYPRL